VTGLLALSASSLLSTISSLPPFFYEAQDILLFPPFFPVTGISSRRQTLRSSTRAPTLCDWSSVVQSGASWLWGTVLISWLSPRTCPETFKSGFVLGCSLFSPISAFRVSPPLPRSPLRTSPSFGWTEKYFFFCAPSFLVYEIPLTHSLLRRPTQEKISIDRPF